MSTNLPAERKPQLVTGGKVAALVPQTMEEAYRLAQAISASGMAPQTMKEPEKILIAIMAGAEVGLAPWQSVQSIAVINNRPTMWGDGLMAVVRSHGCRIKEWIEGADEEMVAFCEVTRPDSGEVIQRDFSVGDAKKANLLGKAGPWQTNRKRMLQMRARAFALRDGCADMLRGMHVREEVEDFQHIRDVTPKPSGLRERLSGPRGEGFTAANAPAEPVNFAEQADAVDGIVEEIEAEPDHVEAELADDAPADAHDLFPGDQPSSADAAQDGADIIEWAGAFLRSLDSFDDVDELRTAWVGRKGELAQRNPDMFRQLNKAVADRAAAIAGA